MGTGDETPLQRLVKERLQESGLSVDQVAARGGISRNTVYSLLRRHDVSPTLATLRKLATGLDLPLSQLTSAAEGRQPDAMDRLLDGDDFEVLSALWAQLDLTARARVLWLARDHLPPEARGEISPVEEPTDRD